MSDAAEQAVVLPLIYRKTIKSRGLSRFRPCPRLLAED